MSSCKHLLAALALTAVAGTTAAANVRLRHEERQRIDQPATDLAEAGGAHLTRSDWLIALLR